MKPGINITSQRAEEYGLEGIRDGESEMKFKERISGALRDLGHPIEAHEAYNNALYNDPTDSDTMTGLLGVAALALSQVPPAVDGVHQIGDDIAAGFVAKEPKHDDLAALGMMLMLLGGKK